MSFTGVANGSALPGSIAAMCANFDAIRKLHMNAMSLLLSGS